MKKMTWCLMLLALATLPAAAQNERKELASAPNAPGAKPESIKAWQELRFGMFIHWGPVSLKGTEIGWSRIEPDRPGSEKRIGIGHKGIVPTAEYDSLYKRFNPVKFDARAWVALAKAAGMKYMVLTTKHHDGFCEFDSKLTDYKITNSPFGRDVVKEYADAVHEAGLKLGFYYSQPDWHHPDFMTPNHRRYIDYIHGQVRELLTHYGKVDIIWFDGLGGRAADFDAEPLIKMIRQLQPGIVINNRCGLPQDFDTPEQRIGTFQNTRPWETCMTICRQWAWKPGDTMKSFEECIRTLVSCACGDGNLLFNVGPMPTGEIEPRQVKRLKEMGAWMKKNGETIYGTRGGPFLMGKNGGSTHKENIVWLHVFKYPEGGLTLPDINSNIVSARVGDVALKLERAEGGVVIDVPQALRDPVDTIVRLELNTPAEKIKPVSIWRDASLSTGKAAKASNVYQNQVRAYGPAMAIDGDEATRWATDAKVKQATLEVDLGKAETIGAFRLVQSEYPRVSKFQIEIERDGQWASVHEGTKKPGEGAIKLSKPVTAQKVRLNILEVSEGGPTIQEFQVLAPEKPKK